MKMRKKVLIFALFFLMGCSGDGKDKFVVDGRVQPPGEDLVEGADTPERVPAVPATLDAQWIDGTTGQIYTEGWVPNDCTKETPCPAVLLVPDKLNGLEEFSCCAGELAKILHAVVITYNPPGRGTAGQVSEGEEDYGGTISQDVLKDVANMWEKKSIVDGSSFGIVSMGFGVGIAAGAIARFQETSLKFVGYFIDVEGPPNRCYVTQSPFFVSPDDDDYYVNEDGEGVSSTRCDFENETFERKDVFPAGTSTDGKGTLGTPNSYICHENAFVLRETGRTCADDKWWQEREAKNYLSKLKNHYLRIQCGHDHEQPSRYNARHTFRWIAQATTASYQLNNAPRDEPIHLHSEQTLFEAGAYLDTSVGNGLGDATFDTLLNFSKVSKQEFYLGILPQFVKKMKKRIAE